MFGTLFSFIIFDGIFFSAAIINGDDVQFHDVYTYTVAIKYSDDQYGCNGAIIAERFIVSAASCFVDERFEFVGGPMKVVAGTLDLRRTNDARSIEVEVEKVYVPVDYGVEGHRHVDDIAVVKLKNRLELAENHLQQLFVADQTSITFAGESAIVSGFGWGSVTVTVKRDGSVSKTGDAGDELRAAKVVVLDNESCEKREYKSLRSSQLCAKMDEDDFFLYGTCEGDRGGPLVSGSTLIGVLSTSTPACNEAYFPALYTRLSSYTNFIHTAFLDNTTAMTFKAYASGL